MPIDGGAGEAPPRQRAAEPDRRDHRHHGDDRHGHADVPPDAAPRPPVDDHVVVDDDRPRRPASGTATAAGSRATPVARCPFPDC